MGAERVWYSTVQSLRADTGPEDGFPEGVRGDQGALEGVEQLRSVKSSVLGNLENGLENLKQTQR